MTQDLAPVGVNRISTESMPDRPLLAGSEMHMAVHQVVSCERSRRLMVGEGRDE